MSQRKELLFEVASQYRETHTCTIVCCVTFKILNSWTKVFSLNFLVCVCFLFLMTEANIAFVLSLSQLVYVIWSNSRLWFNLFFVLISDKELCYDLKDIC